MADGSRDGRYGEALFRAFSEPLALIGAQGEVIAVNRAFASAFAEDASGDGGVDICARLLRVEPIENLLCAMHAVVPGVHPSPEIEIAAPDGRLFAVRLSTLEDGGALLLHLREISEQAARARLQDQAVRESEARMRLALQAAKMSTWDWDLTDDALTWDAEQHRLFGIPPHLFSGQGAQALSVIHEEDRPRVEAAIRAAVEAGGQFEEEFRVCRPDGEIRWLAGVGRVAPHPETGALDRMIGVNYDISDRKNAEAALERSHSELETRVSERTAALSEQARRREDAHSAQARAQRLEAIGQLAGGVAHDFNNLLSVIGGNLELAELRIADPQARDLIHSALQAVEHGASLTKRLLAFAQKRALAPESIVLNTFVVDLAHLLDRTLGEDVEIRLDLDPELWPTVVDPGEVDCVLLNLAMNARDAMKRGGEMVIATTNLSIGPRIHELDPDAAPGDYVRLSVSDTGAGMTKEVAARAFDPFFTTKDSGQGTGLGLSSVFGFAKQLGGFTTLDTAEGEGAVVSLYLPRSMNGQVADRPDCGLRTENGSGRLILAVEDDPDVRALTLERVRTLGYSVIGAADAREAIERLTADPSIELVFSDIAMPGGMSGYDLLQWVRRHRPSVKVLLTTGYEDGRYPDVEVLYKPYSLKSLGERLRRCLAPEPSDG